MPIYGFDISPYLAGPCDASALRKLVYSERFSRAILAIDTGDNFFDWYRKVTILPPIKHVDCYRELTTPDQYHAEIDNTLAALEKLAPNQEYVVRDIWLTFENTNVPPTIEQIWDAINYAREKLDVHIYGEIGVYTGWWYWGGVLNNPQVGFDVPLWDANYSAGPNFEVNYGGWVRATVRQIQGDYKSYGLDVDVDVWEE